MAEVNASELVGEQKQAVIIRADETLVEVTCFITQAHNFSNTLSTNVVESGIDITDNVKEDAHKIKLKGITSNNSTSIFSLINSFKTLVSPDNDAVSAANDTFTAFYEMYKTKEIVTVATNYFVYEDMVLTNFSTTEDKNNSESLEFSVEFTERRTTDKATGEGKNLAGKSASISADAAKKSKTDTVNKKNKKPGAGLDKAGRKEVLQSWLAKIMQWLAGA